MFRHNLLIVFRNFKRFKGTFLINIIGLSTGLACTLLIYLWVVGELNFDKFHEKDARLYQVMENQALEEGIKTTDGTTGALSEALKQEMPEVEYAATVTPAAWFPKVNLTYGDKSIKAAGQFAGADFFNIFSYQLIQGSKDQVLADKKSMVISEDLAKRMFGTTDNVVGKPIKWQWQQFGEEYLVSGVYKSNPNSSAQFDYLVPFAWIKEKFTFMMDWGNYGPNTFVVLKPGASVQQFNAKLAGFMKKKLPETNRTLFAARYSDNYLYGKYENGVQAGGRIEYVKLFSIIAIFILIIACVNFMNLSTAKASQRMKEVGLKKTLGASRGSLIFQYFAESLLIAFISLLIAVIMVLIFLPQFNHITGKHISLWPPDPKMILAFFGITIIAGVLSGSYPALYLSSFNPVTVLKGMLKHKGSELWIRKGLVVFQFAISVILIVCVLVTYKQIGYIQNKNLGYTKDNIIYFEKEGKVAASLETFLSEVKNVPGVVNAAAIGQNLVGTPQSNTMGVEWPGKPKDANVQFYNIGVNYDLIETIGVQMIQGRSFSRNYGAENTKIIFNEAAIKVMGITDPIGKTIKLWDKDMEIIGVAKNFHFETLHEAVKPLFFRLAPENAMGIMVKIKAGTEKETLANLRSFYSNFNPGFVLDYKFLDEDYQAQYVSETRVAILSRYFAGLAILISCLGLFGLAAFTAERRFKEIGIRKTLGSSDFNIIYLLSKDFTFMVITSIVIALPLSYLLTKRWLDSFQYRISLEVWYFIGAGIAALLITWITVGIQALKATRVNPVQTLRVNN